MHQHFFSWWRGGEKVGTTTTSAAAKGITTTITTTTSCTEEGSNEPLTKQTKTVSWYGSISLTPATSASSSLTSSPHDQNRALKGSALSNNKAKRSAAKGDLPLVSGTGTMSSFIAGEPRQPLLVGNDSSHIVSPVDPLHNGHNYQHKKSEKKQSPPSLCWGAVANLCAATLGAGLLALPFAFAKAGWIGGLILLTGSAMATQASISMIVMAAGAAKVSVMKARAAGETVAVNYRSDSYESLVEYLLGRPWRRLVEVCLVIFCFGCIIGYTITVGDLLEAAHLTHGDYRVKSMVAVWFIAMFPLSLLRRMQSLQWASAVGIASIGTLVVATLVNLIEDATRGTPDPTSNHTDTNTTILMMSMISASGTGPKVDIGANFVRCLWPKDWISFIRALPLILFAFSCQVNVCAIYDELPEESADNSYNASNALAAATGEDHREEEQQPQTQQVSFIPNGDWTGDAENLVAASNGHLDRSFSQHQLQHTVQEQQVAMFRRVSRAAVAICAFLYASIALIGMANFGRHVLPNILSNYQVPINAMMQAAFAGTALAVIMAFPLNVFPVRITLRGLLCTRHPIIVNDNSTCQTDKQVQQGLQSSAAEGNDGLCQPLLQQQEKQQMLTLDHSEAPEWAVAEALEWTGADSQALDLPLSDEPEERDEGSFAAHFLLTFMIAGSALGIALVLPNISVVFGLLGGSTTSILGFVIPGFLGLAALDNSSNNAEEEEWTRMTGKKSSVSIRRWHCWVLVVGGAIIGVVTTIVTIYSYTS